MILICVFLTAFTAVFSYLHGRGDGPDLQKQWYETKGILIAGEALVGGVAGVALAGWLGMLGVLLSPLYWFLFRSSRQATPELNYMSRYEWAKLPAVWQAYVLPVGVCCALVIGGSLYAKAWLHLALVIPCIVSVGLVSAAAREFRNDPGEVARQNRWPVEVANGICGGVNISCVLAALVVVLI